MIRSFATLVCLLTLGANSKAQGLIHFVNTPTTLITTSFLEVDLGPIPPIAGQYYFQLFVAPVGTVDISQFLPTSVQGTNLASAGRFSGGMSVAVPGVLAGSTMAILVRGWTATLGSDYDTAYNNSGGGLDGDIGVSDIAPNFVFGGFDGSVTTPTSAAFGGANGIQRGFDIGFIPEPSTAALTALGALALFGRQRRKP